MDIQPGAVILDRYRVEGVLGAGGMGQVFLARHVHLGTKVALKLLRHDEDPLAEERFHREAELMARVRHVNVVSVLDFGMSLDGAPCIAMEYVDGVSLEDHLMRRSAIAWGEASEALQGILAGLEAMHAAGIMHRDLKPSNVILVDDDLEQPKLIDFGIAKPLDPSAIRGDLTRAGILVGTPAYMSPEQLVGARVDQRSDLYAAALIWYEAVTGRLLYDSDDFTELMRRVREPAPVPVAPSSLPEVPDAVADVVLSALAIDPADRPADAATFSAQLRAAARVGRGSRPPSRGERDRLSIPSRSTPSAAPSGTRGRYLVAAVLPPTRLGLAEERRWLASQLGDRARGYTLGAQVWVALQGAATSEDEARHTAESLCAAVMERFGPTSVASWAVVESDFALTAPQLIGAKPLPPELKGLLDAML
ncbi:MAG: protein kinase [Polyangiales bacterium]